MKEWIGLSLFLTLYSTPSYAYLDPGTGSLILQVFTGVALTGLIYIKRISGWIKGWFRK